MKVAKTFFFESAHWIPGHKTCGRMHGHSYKLVVVCDGFVNQDGFVIDFRKLKEIVTKEVVEVLDHQALNEINGLELPTAENICFWIQNRLLGKIPLKTITLWETRDSYAELEYR